MSGAPDCGFGATHSDRHGSGLALLAAGQERWIEQDAAAMCGESPPYRIAATVIQPAMSGGLRLSSRD